jgi:hypothetical protein
MNVGESVAEPLPAAKRASREMSPAGTGSDKGCPNPLPFDPALIATLVTAGIPDA